MCAYSRLTLCAPGSVPAVTLTSNSSSGDNRGTVVGAVADSVVAGRWLWTSGRLAEAHLGVSSGDGMRTGTSGWISWDVQAANAAPSLLMWQQRQARQAVGQGMGQGSRQGLGQGLGQGIGGQGLEAVGMTAVLSGLYR